MSGDEVEGIQTGSRPIPHPTFPGFLLPLFFIDIMEGFLSFPPQNTNSSRKRLFLPLQETHHSDTLNAGSAAPSFISNQTTSLQCSRAQQHN